jgi:hypothetical protein
VSSIKTKKAGLPTGIWFLIWALPANILGLTNQDVWFDWFFALIGFFPALLFVDAVIRHPKFLASLVAKGKLSQSGLFIFFAFLLAFSFFQIPSETRFWGSAKYSAVSLASISGVFFLQGAVIGGILRHCCGHLAFSHLRAKNTLWVRLCVFYIWVLAMHMFPRSGAHIEFGPPFVVGLALGVFVHQLIRRSKRRAAIRRRRILHLVDAYESVGLTGDERRVLEMLRKGKSEKYILHFINSIRKELNDEKEQIPPVLRLVRSSLLRAQGDFSESNRDLPRLPEKNDLIKGDEVYLLLIRALNDLDDRKLTSDEFQAVLEILCATSRGKKCAPVKASQSLRLAESVIKPFDQSPLIGSGALNLANEAVDLKYEQEPNVRSVFLNMTAPIPRCFFRDVVGTALLADGKFDEAELYLFDCIHDDPDYSGAYVHLGDLFWYRHNFGLVPQSGKDFIFHAKVCYEAALKFEGNVSNHVTRRARERLNKLPD